MRNKDTPVLRKHSALVTTYTDKEGMKWHYIYIGGKYYLAGSSSSIFAGCAKDGFWEDSITKMISWANGSKELAHRIGDTKVTYMREWYSNTVLITDYYAGLS